MRLSVNRWHSRNGLGSTGISLTDSVLHKGNAVVIIDLSQLGGTTRNGGIDASAEGTLQAFEAMSYFPDKLNAAGPRSA
jgi:hypothetical protein